MHQPSHSVLSGNQSAAPTARGAITVEVRHDLDLADDDLESLNSFIEDRPDAGVFMSTAWLTGFIADPQPNTELMIVLLRDGRVLVRWSATAAQHVDFADYLAERVDLLTNPPEGA